MKFDEQWRARQSAAHKKLWAEGKHRPRDRDCIVCHQTYSPPSGRSEACSPWCRSVAQRARRLKIDPFVAYELWNAQEGRCALCGGTEGGYHRASTGKRKSPEVDGPKLHLDHCHRTGKIRGWLCGDCNTALGRFGDDPARLAAAISYLDRSRDAHVPDAACVDPS